MVSGALLGDEEEADEFDTTGVSNSGADVCLFGGGNSSVPSDSSLFCETRWRSWEVLGEPSGVLLMLKLDITVRVIGGELVEELDWPRAKSDAAGMLVDISVEERKG